MDENITPTETTEMPSTTTEAPNNIPGALPGETKTETAKRLYKVKVDGNEVEVDEDELLKGYSHGRAAHEKMAAAAKSRKEVDEVLRILKNNPREAFNKLGLNAREFAESLIREQLEESLMDPKDKELRDYKKKVESFESERRTAQEAYEKQREDEELAKHTQAIQSDIIETLSTAGLPKTERTVSRIVYYMQSALAAGYNVRPQDVIEHVKQDYVHDFKSFMGGLSEQQIENVLG